jgi:3-hydroxybutyrate dehydrogenase
MLQAEFRRADLHGLGTQPRGLAAQVRLCRSQARHLGVARTMAKEGAKHNVRANVICPGFVMIPLVQEQIPEHAKELGITEERVVKKVMLGETVDKEFTMVDDIAEIALLLGGFKTNALKGESIIVSHGWHMN